MCGPGEHGSMGQCWLADVNRLSLGVWSMKTWIDGVSVGLLM